MSIVNLNVCCFSVAACKTVYRKMRDAARYRKNKHTGKSGDSAGEDNFEDTPERSHDSSSMDDYPFLTPNSSKYPRKTLSFGGSSSTIARSDSGSSKLSMADAYGGGNDDDIAPEWVHDSSSPGVPMEPESKTASSVYSYVSISIILLDFLCTMKLISFVIFEGKQERI